MNLQYMHRKAGISNEMFQLAGRWNGSLPNQSAIIEEKIDGWRAGYWRGLDGMAKLWTRNGHEIRGVDHILKRLALMERIATEPMMFDGEFQVGGALHTTKAWCERGWKDGGVAGTFYLFDAMPESQWREGGCSIPLIERKSRLQWLCNAAQSEIDGDWAWQEGSRGKVLDTPPIAVLTHDETMSQSGVEILAAQVWARGGEGVMVKDPIAAYTRGRNNSWLKLKKGQTT